MLMKKLNEMAAGLDALWTRRPASFWLPFTLLLAVVSIALANYRMFWHDELGTALTTANPGGYPITTRLRGCVDMMPPFYFVITQAVTAPFGVNEISLRLPSLFGVWLACFSFYWLVRRELSALAAVAGVFALLSTGIRFFLWEARSYGLLAGLEGLGVLCWQRCEEPRRRWWLVGLAVSLTLAISVHYYASLGMVPLGIAELWRNWRHRRIDWPVWLAFSVPVLVLAGHLPLIRAGLECYGQDPSTAYTPSFSLLPGMFQTLLGGLPKLLLLAAITLLPAAAVSRGAVSRPFWILLATLAALPVIAITLGVGVGLLIQPRYVLPTTLGLTGLFIGILWRLWGAAPLRWASLAAISFLLLCNSFYNDFERFTQPIYNWGWVKDNVPADGPPVVIAWSHDWFPAYYYRAALGLPLIVLPVSTELESRYLTEDTGSVNHRGFARFVPGYPAPEWEAFAAANRRFRILRHQNAPDWLMQHMRARGIPLVPTAAGGGWEVYTVDLPDGQP